MTTSFCQSVDHHLKRVCVAKNNVAILTTLFSITVIGPGLYTAWFPNDDVTLMTAMTTVTTSTRRGAFKIYRHNRHLRHLRHRRAD